MQETSERPKVKISDMGSFIGRSPYFYNIRSEDNQIISYTSNESQLRLNSIIEEEKRRTKKMYGYEQIRLIVLKGRQLGVSTDTAMRNTDSLSRIPLYNAQVLAHDDETTSLLYDIYQRAYDYMPETVDLVDDKGNVVQSNYPIKPEHKSYSGKRLAFKGLDSRLNVRTAGGGDNVGKGITLNAVHLSEFANYVHGKDVFNSTSQALPRKANIYSVIESTANGISGIGEEFYKMWDKSETEWGRYENGQINHFDGYRPVFLPWYEHSKYMLNMWEGNLVSLEGVDFGTIGEKEFKEREEFLIEEMGLPLERINWYRWCIKNKCSYDLNDAYRYYPTFPKDAFLASDSCFFNSNELFAVNADLRDNGEDEHEIGDIDDEFEFEEESTGDLKVYEWPDPTWENRYVIGCDPSKNVEGGDFGAVFVYDRLEQKFVAKWYGRMEEDQLALKVMQIGYFYNTGLLIPEGNLSTMVNIIKPDGLVPYNGDLFFMQRGNKIEFGYHQDKKSRKDLLDHYKIWIRENYDKLPDRSSVQEHIDFIKVKKQGYIRPEAKDDKHDDQVFAMALCVWGAEYWEEDLAKLNDEGTDYEQIFKAEHGRSKGLRQSQLGRKGKRGFRFPKDAKSTKRKRHSHTKLGKRR